MADILPDKEIEKLLGNCIINGEKEHIKSSSYVLRLGEEAKFFSTNETKNLAKGSYLEIGPGEMVLIHSIEDINFKEAVQEIYPGCELAGFITPTTTMMREGFLFSATRIEPGFKGTLNWSIRNSTTKPILLPFGEELFKLTIFKLSEHEKPDLLSGALTCPRFVYHLKC